jgi:hypothetical protein
MPYVRARLCPWICGPSGFLEELESLPPFRRLGSYDEAIAKREAPRNRRFCRGCSCLAMLVDTEDVDQSALVLFDARIDWKMKADLIVLRCDGERTKALRVSIYGQSDEDRATLEHERDEQERHMKANTSDSSHWRNKTHGALPLLKISKTRGDVIMKQNFHLFSLEAMEQLMADIDNILEWPRTKAMPIARMLQYRGK